ncbi:hypothetical protein D3C72_1491560 [compost metagenome]
MVVIAGLAPHIDHAVDGRTAAQDFSARIDQAAPAQSRVRLRGIQPVRAGIADAMQIADGDVDPHVIVLAACFHEQNIGVLVACEPVGQHATCRAAAHDDVVVFACRFQ